MRLPNTDKVCHTIRDSIGIILDNFPDGGTFVELGTYLGNTAAFIVCAFVLEEKSFEFYNVDNFYFSNIPNGQKTIDGNPDGYNSYIENVKRLGVDKYIRTLELNTLDAASYFKEGSIDCLFIDDDHGYEHVKNELKIWTPKVKKGGLIIGDDYSDINVGRAYRETFGNIQETPRGGCIICIN